MSRLSQIVEQLPTPLPEVAADTAATLTKAASAITRRRLSGKVRPADADDAAQVAAVLAVALLPQMLDQDPAAAAAVAAYRCSLAAVEDAGRSKEDAADVLAYEEVAADRIALPRTIDPAALARPTDRDRLATAFESLRREMPATAQVLAFATYATPQGTASKDEVSARATATLLGLSDRKRKALSKALPAMIATAQEHMAATIYRYGPATPNTHRGADTATWTAHRAQIERPSIDGAAPLTPGTWTTTILTAPETVAPYHLTRTRREIHPGADQWSPFHPSKEQPHQVERHTGTVATFTQEQSPTSRPTRIGKAPTLPRTGTASAVIHRYAEDPGAPFAQVTSGPNPTLIAVTEEAAAYLLAQVDMLTPYTRTAGDTRADNFAAAQEPLGAVKKPQSSKRKRDGALGAPTTSGTSRTRY